MSYQLDQEEQEILAAFEQGSFQSAVNADDEIAKAEEAARQSLNKTRRINLRLTERDYQLAHIRAMEEGIPYQTLLASVIHKYLTDRLTEKPR